MTYASDNQLEQCPLCGGYRVDCDDIVGSTHHLYCGCCHSTWSVSTTTVITGWEVTTDNTDQLEAAISYNIAQHLRELMEESDSV